MSGTQTTTRPGGTGSTGAPRGQNPRSGRRRIVAAGATGVILLAGVGLLAWLHDGSDVPSGPPTKAITLPTRIDGLKAQAAADDRTGSTSWLEQAKAAGGGATVVARTYGTGGWSRSIRVVAARTNLTGKLDLTMAAAKGTAIGNDRCTQDVVLVPGTKAKVRPTVMLCWRTDARFSVSSWIIDPLSKGVSAADGAAAVDAVWTAALKQH